MPRRRRLKLLMPHAMPALLAIGVFALGTSFPPAVAAADDEAPAPKAVSRPQTRPATTMTIPRAMVWDRVRQEADTAKQLADMERGLATARKLVEAQPDDPTSKSAYERATKLLQDARARADEQRKRFAEAKLPPLEKATYLGIATSPAPPVLRKQLKLVEGMGLVVDFVEPGSPAEAAGVQPYDVAVRLNDQVLVNAPQLAVLVRTFDPGAEVTLAVIREGKETALKVKLVEREVKAIADTTFGPGWGDFNRALPRAVQHARQQPPADYLIKTGDALRVTVFDLEAPGLRTTVNAIITPDGTLKLPWVDAPVTVRGLTELQAQSAISDAFGKANVLERANVSVQVTPAGSGGFGWRGGGGEPARGSARSGAGSTPSQNRPPSPTPAPSR